MEFCIATTAYWQSIGFDTTNWRKSVDSTKAIVHCEYACILCDCKNNPNMQMYQYPSKELDDILTSPEWAVEVVV